jgi:hypothetical protein
MTQYLSRGSHEHRSWLLTISYRNEDCGCPSTRLGMTISAYSSGHRDHGGAVDRVAVDGAQGVVDPLERK